MICTRCQTEPVERCHPRKLRKHTKQDYEYTKAAGFKMTAGADGKAAIVWIPRFHCDCGWLGQLRMIAEDLLPLVDDPRARREERRRAGLERYLHTPRAA